MLREVALAITVAGCAPPTATPATVTLPAPAPPTRDGPATAPDAPRKAAAKPDAIAWETSDRDAREKARRGARPMIVWARADWAAPAHQMERATWTDPRVVAAARGLVALRLDLTDAEDPNAALLAERYEITAMPATLILDARGQRVAVVNGFADAGAILAAIARLAE